MTGGLRVGQRVRVHVNLHRGMLSVIDPTSGLVVAHASTVILEQVTFRVQPGGHARVVATGRRSVHAYAVGYLRAWDDAPDVSGWTPVRYNPFRAARFTLGDTDAAVIAAPLVVFTARCGWVPTS